MERVFSHNNNNNNNIRVGTTRGDGRVNLAASFSHPRALPIRNIVVLRDGGDRGRLTRRYFKRVHIRSKHHARPTTATITTTINNILISYNVRQKRNTISTLSESVEIACAEINSATKLSVEGYLY